MKFLVCISKTPDTTSKINFTNNNTIVRQNEQSLVVDVCELESQDARGVFKNVNVDMRQYKKLKMFIHAEDGEANSFNQGDLVDVVLSFVFKVFLDINNIYIFIFINILFSS